MAQSWPWDSQIAVKKKKKICHKIHWLHAAHFSTVFVNICLEWWNCLVVVSIASTWTTRVSSDSSVKLLPCVFSNEFRIEWVLLICCSQTLPILLANAFFSTPFNHHHLLLKRPIFLWFISWKERISSANAPTIFVSLLDLIILTISLCPIKRLKLTMNKSVLNEWTTSICIALLERQVHKAPYFLKFIAAIFYHKWVKNVNATICKWWFYTHIIWQIYHHLLLKLSSQLFTSNIFPNHWLHQWIGAYDAKTSRSYLVDCDTSSSMCNPIMTPSYYQFRSFAGLQE